ncbi:MAG: hypothetical protein K2M91_16775 [Lachnospiraceae bacterium]|nr:hypothetical protein [Lachnospiraceae bacterium]
MIPLGGYENNRPEAVKDLEKPYGGDARPHFEDMEITPEYFEGLFSEAMEKAKENGTAVWTECGRN